MSSIAKVYSPSILLERPRRLIVWQLTECVHGICCRTISDNCRTNVRRNIKSRTVSHFSWRDATFELVSFYFDIVFVSFPCSDVGSWFCSVRSCEYLAVVKTSSLFVCFSFSQITACVLVECLYSRIDRLMSLFIRFLLSLIWDVMALNMSLRLLAL